MAKTFPTFPSTDNCTSPKNYIIKPNINIVQHYNYFPLHYKTNNSVPKASLMGFTRGQHIEVASKEEGYVGSYYEAVVVTEVLRQEYIVEYKTLLKEDLSGPLREVVTAAEIRPPPPQVEVLENGFEKFDRVDAFDNDGWWVGTITEIVGTKYYVYFGTTGEQMAYDVGSLRVHQDWIDGKWVIPKRQ